MELSMQVETQAEFSRRMRVNRSTVTRWKRDQRLALTEDGRIDVQASLRKLTATEGVLPAHIARREQLAEQRAAPEPPAEDEPKEAEIEGMEAIGIATKRAALRKLQAEADRAQMERDLQRGNLIERREVAKDLADAVAVILNAAETLPDRLAPVLTGVAEQSTVRAILRDEVEQLLATVSERLVQVVKQ
jgi:transcriptional regulator with XRE-family HTH domain